MIIISRGDKFLPKTEHGYSLGDKSYPSDIFAIKVFYINIFFAKNKGRFRKYFKQFTNNDFELHPQVRLARKKAIAKANARYKAIYQESIDGYLEMLKESYRENKELEMRLITLQQTIKGLDIIKCSE
jgi:disulfide oxidoreductase YuzD